jgi:hypothetical protein
VVASCRCPKGHQWTLPNDPTEPVASVSVCPVCGVASADATVNPADAWVTVDTPPPHAADPPSEFATVAPSADAQAWATVPPASDDFATVPQSLLALQRPIVGRSRQPAAERRGGGDARRR